MRQTQSSMPIHSKRNTNIPQNRCRHPPVFHHTGDVAQLSPLGFEHVNMLGRYAFILSGAVA